LKSKDIQGQEETGVEFDDGEKIEPFNMNDEFEEGDFDESGYYTLKKNSNESHDPWLDSITIKDVQKAKEAQERLNARMEEDTQTVNHPKSKLLKDILLILRPKETTLQALKRLGGKGNKPGQNKNKKNESEKDERTEEQKKRDLEHFDTLTEYSYQLMSKGVPEIYSYTYEQLGELLSKELPNSKDQKGKQKEKENSNQTPKEKSKPKEEEAENSDEELERLSERAEQNKINNNNQNNNDNGNQIIWRYKWTEDGEIYGPFNSQQMQAWAEQGAFAGGILVAKGNSTDFTSSKRIDFSLYIDD